MNTPITTNFFKKIEIFQEIISLNRIFYKSVMEFSNGAKDTWEIEKKFLYWTRLGHKHLGSALKAVDFDEDKVNNKLKDVRLTQSEVREFGGSDQYWLKNLVRRGYAEYKNRDDAAGILVNEKGLLVGAVLSDIYKLKKISKQKVWHRWFWHRYEKNYDAQHFLSKRYKYWLYKLAVSIGWLVFAAAAILVLWTFVNKVWGVLL